MKASIIDTPKKINSYNQKISSKELYDTINRASTHEDTLIKLYEEKEEEYLVIFSWKDKNKWKIDYPIQHNKIHKQRYVTHKQCLQLAEHIYNGNSLDELKGFIDVPIRHFTLDDMLQFKKEDEMMLKGQDPNTDTIKKEKVTATPKTETALKPKKEKAIPKTAIEMGKKLNIKTPKAENIVKNTTEKIIKNKLKDDGSLFQI